MQWNISELCFCSNNTLTLQFCSPFSTLHYSRSFYIALCTLHFVLYTLHFALCTLHFAFCTLHCSRYFCNVLGTLHLFQTLLYPSYYFALFQNTLVYPLYYILLYLKHSYVSVRHRVITFWDCSMNVCCFLMCRTCDLYFLLFREDVRHV